MGALGIYIDHKALSVSNLIDGTITIAPTTFIRDQLCVPRLRRPLLSRSGGGFSSVAVATDETENANAMKLVALGGIKYLEKTRNKSGLMKIVLSTPSSSKNYVTPELRCPVTSETASSNEILRYTSWSSKFG